MRRLLLLFLFVSLQVFAPPGPLTTPERSVFHDPRAFQFSAPNDLNPSFLTSNESGIQHFKPALSAARESEGLQGYIGLASEQNYTLISYAKPDFVWLYDRDPKVIGQHRLYQLAFKKAASPEEFLSLFSGSPELLSQLIAETHSNNLPLSGRLLSLLRDKDIRREIAGQLNRLRVQTTPTFLNSAEAYQTVRNLHLMDRIQLVEGDHLSDPVFETIGESAKKLNVSISGLYLSNSLDYPLDIPRKLVKGLKALPFSKDASVLIVQRPRVRDRPVSEDAIERRNYEIHPAGIPWAYVSADARSFIEKLAVRLAEGKPILGCTEFFWMLAP